MWLPGGAGMGAALTADRRLHFRTEDRVAEADHGLRTQIPMSERTQSLQARRPKAAPVTA